MKVIQWNLNRKNYLDVQTLGRMDVISDNVWQYCLASLEQEWNDNEVSDSCIPAGTYTVIKHNSPTHGKCFKVLDVPGRSQILFHKLNFYKQSEGCTGVGLFHHFLNSDIYMDIAESGKALSKLKETCEGDVRILLTIK